MIKITLLISFFIFFFTGCENSSDLKKLAQQLRKEKSIKNHKILPKKKSISKIIKTNKKEKIIKEVEKKLLVNKEETKTKTKVNTNIKNLNLTTLNKKILKIKFKKDGITFENFPNKIIILDIFTTWCPPCIQTLPHMISLQKKYKKNLQVIGILMDEKIRESEALEFKQKHHINYMITIGKNNRVLTDTWGGISGFPTIIIFDKNGTYFNHYNGAPPLEMLQSDMKKVLRKK